ncbi:MAG TPA: hypothetical protein VF500_22305, partial [Mucilaginibacter sp.]
FLWHYERHLWRLIRHADHIFAKKSWANIRQLGLILRIGVLVNRKIPSVRKDSILLIKVLLLNDG